MKIIEIKILRGPNFWSVRRNKLIQMKIDLEEMEQIPTNKIPGFKERLEKLMPSLYEHRCSEGVAGGFFMRVDEGTWMGHVIEHIALEIQTLAGMDTGFGRTRGTGVDGEYYVCFSYLEEDAGVYAAKASFKIVEALINGQEYNLEDDIMRLREIREDTRLGPSTGCIVEEAGKRGIPFIRLNKHSLVQLGYGVHQKRIRATIASTTSNIAVDIACDKEETKNLLEAAEIPVPRGMVVRTVDGLQAVVEKCDAVMFSGGNQLRLSVTDGGTEFLSILKKRYAEEEGFIIAGTSAGAMAMSHTMIYEGNASKAHLKGEVKITTGLGFINSLIIDSHFEKRGRFGRLVQAVVCNPGSIGIGLGEDTGMIITEGNKMEAIGSGSVTVVDGHDIGFTNIADVPEGNPFCIENIKVHILEHGNAFLINEKQFIAEVREGALYGKQVAVE